MNKIIIAIMCAFSIATAYAENANVTTSQYYVDVKLNEKQDAAPANNSNAVMTYDSTSSDGIGTKAIYNTNSSYISQTNALLTAGVANSAIQNGINNEFTCANPPKCNLWKITSMIPSKNLLNPANIHQGTILTASGIVARSDRRCYFDYIPVNAGDTVNFTSRNGTPPIYRHIWLYSQPNENAFIGTTTISREPIISDANHSGYRFSIPQDGYIRGLWVSDEYDFTPDDIVEAMVEISSTPNPYEPYEPTYLPQNQQ